MFRTLGEFDLPWSLIDTWQVDERIAPLDHPDRNLTQQLRALPGGAVPGMRPMPVDDDDLEAAADRYAGGLPARLDMVQLGIGADGHTASLVPGDPILGVRDRDVALTALYRGRRRMTLTYPALARAERVVWVVTGPEKRDAVAKVLISDRSIPATMVPVNDQVLVATPEVEPDASRRAPEASQPDRLSQGSA